MYLYFLKQVNRHTVVRILCILPKSYQVYIIMFPHVTKPRRVFDVHLVHVLVIIIMIPLPPCLSCIRRIEFPFSNVRVENKGVKRSNDTHPNE